MSDFRPPTPTYRAQLASVWNWWKSLCAKPQLWGVYLVFSGLAVLDPTPNALFADYLARPIGAIGVIVSTLMVRRNWTRGTRDRGQITIPDIVFFAAALIIIGGFAGPIYQLLNDNAGELSASSAYLLQMAVPGLLVTLLVIFFALATTRGGQ